MRTILLTTAIAAVVAVLSLLLGMLLRRKLGGRLKRPET